MPSSLIERGQDGPVTKRQRLNGADAPRTTKRESKLFSPFRTIGLVSSTPVPFTSVALGQKTFQITTSVGRCLQTYDLKRGLGLIFLTRPQTPEDITATLACKDVVFAAFGGGEATPGFWVFKRGKKVAELDVPTDLVEPIKQILTFGTWIVGCCTTRIEVWKSSTYEHYTTLYPTAAPKGGNELTGGISNMPTYLNKIFAGRKDGGVEIWNVNSGKLIFTIMPPAANCGAVTVLQPTPALSLLAIAYSEGPLIIHDIRTDKTVIQLDGGNSPVTSISFRTDDLGAGDDGRKAGVMATAGPDTGDVTFWDLNNGGRVMGILRGAHNPPSDAGVTVGGGVSKVEFLWGQQVVVTSGLDNSLKTWIFDESPFSPIPRILHSRSGHAAPVTKLLFLPSDFDGADSGGKWLLSAGKDRSLWGWSLRKDAQSTELSQGNIRKKAKKLGLLANTLANQSSSLEDLKAPEITCVAMSLNRDGGFGANAGNGAIWQKGIQRDKKPTDATSSGMTGWESVVTGHRQDNVARTWFWGRKRAGRWALETGDGGYVSSVAMSPCGTFAVVGSETGGIDTFNLQSGQHRQRYPCKLTKVQAKKIKLQLQLEAEGSAPPAKSGTFQLGLGKHRKAVTGLVVDSLNKNVISCSLDGKVKFWEFGSGKLVDEVDWYPQVGLTGIRYHAPNDLIALACDDLSIRIVDLATKKTIRELRGCQGSINDFCFSNDGRWIIAASQDCVVRVWDLPTGHLIDAIRMETQCTALSFSATGEFLATTCEGQVGVNIWNNITLFKHVPTRHISESDIASISGPTVSGENGQDLLSGAFEDETSEPEDSAPAPSLEQLSEDIMSLSLVPKSNWMTLLHLDQIKERNKPKEAPKLPEKAPFFLPALDNAVPVSRVDDQSAATTAAERSRIMKMGRQVTEGAFTITLRAGSESGDYTPFITHLKTLSPSTADLEIRSLSPDPSNNEQLHFVHALTSRLKSNRDFDVVQAWMAVFLRLHVETLMLDEEVRDAVREWREVAERVKVGMLAGYSSGVFAFLRSTR
ncbi:Utp21 specific WD40 associated putative domain-containing protein [Cadophora sp. MPI-SDFR-AT-0126]|nr:Utp21 specific WD40 associated putative domain-containing protein [Leotiomycetes sp. MPI-SDFR-AT-0126]